MEQFNEQRTTITITTNSRGNNPGVTGISGQCFDINNNAIPGRNFSGMGPQAQENLQNVTDNCYVTFVWSEPSSNPRSPVTCTEFKLFFTDQNGQQEPGPFGVIPTDFPFSTPLPSGGTLLSRVIVSGDSNWQYSGRVFTSINGATPVAQTFDPEIEVGPID